MPGRRETPARSAGVRDEVKGPPTPRRHPTAPVSVAISLSRLRLVVTRGDLGGPLHGPDQRAGDRSADRLVRPALPDRPAADRRLAAALLQPRNLGAGHHLRVPIRPVSVPGLRQAVTQPAVFSRGGTSRRPAWPDSTLGGAEGGT